MSEPSIEKIIERLQFCIVDARALQLKMLERLLSISLLEAHELREDELRENEFMERSGGVRSNGPH